MRLSVPACSGDGAAPGFRRCSRAIHDPPAVLWLRGEARSELLARPAVADRRRARVLVVRRTVARMLGRELAAAGSSSSAASRAGSTARRTAARSTRAGSTVAVLGCGIDRDYPAAHRELAGRIAESGLIVSEYEPGVEPAPWRFPARNRIIAGLCAATVVVEARERSGALITADFALEDGREVMAVPGEITSRRLGRLERACCGSARRR